MYVRVGNVPKIHYVVGMGQNNHWNHFMLSDRSHSSGSSSLALSPGVFQSTHDSGSPLPASPPWCLYSLLSPFPSGAKLPLTFSYRAGMTSFLLSSYYVLRILLLSSMLQKDNSSHPCSEQHHSQRDRSSPSGHGQMNG